MLARAEKYISQLESDYDDAGHFKEQLVVAHARIFNAKEEKQKALRLVEMQVSSRPNTSVEDNLDKVKVFHELGMREEAIGLLDAVKKQIACDSLAGAVTNKFVEQEAQEKAEIHFTPKQLNSMAVEFFKKKKMAPALDSLHKALRLTPKNIKVALSLLKVIQAIHRDEGLDPDQRELANSTLKMIDGADLDEKQALHYKELRAELGPAVGVDEADESDDADVA